MAKKIRFNQQKWDSLTEEQQARAKVWNKRYGFDINTAMALSTNKKLMKKKGRFR